MTFSGIRPWRSADGFFALPTHSKDKSSLDLWIAEGKRRASSAAGTTTTARRRQRRKVTAALVVVLVLVLGARYYYGYAPEAPPCGSPTCLPSPKSLRPLLADAESALQHPIWDWRGLARRARLFRALLGARYTPDGEMRVSCDGLATEETLAALDGAIKSVERNLYPWIKAGAGGGGGGGDDADTSAKTTTPTTVVVPSSHASASALLASYAGSGIVMTTGNFHADHAILAIRNIRRLGCSLPIQLFYLDDDDLAPAHRDRLALLPNVRTISIKRIFDVYASQQQQQKNERPRLGWEMKPFAILASTFRHTIFIDADVVFLQSPERMLTYPLYTQQGTLLFRDRTLYPGGKPTEEFFLEVMDGLEPSARYWDGRVGRKLSVHEGESGVVVVDKVRNFHAVLMTTLMNAPGPFKEDMYRVIHGDKESYWIAHEMLALPYAWSPGGGGTIGFHTTSKNENITTICGQLYHPDPHWKPLWMNGGITANKHTGDKGAKALAFSHWATDPDWVNVQWEWEKVDRPFCLLRNTRDKGKTWDALTDAEKGVLDDAERMWADIKG
ncbi:hypothetical protein HDU86_006100 [Geranomyces michiganensis]|nr:hypothetical protein HDU86_006100 [Geranomyces michiganensis]